MNKQEFLKEVTICGDMPYIVLRKLINHFKFNDEQIKIFILKQLEKNKNLRRGDWELIFMHVLYLDGLSRNITLGWLNDGCKLSGDKLKIFIEYVDMLSYEPTYILTQNGDILITEK